MKIVYLIDHLRGDGAQKGLVELVESLAPRGHQQTVVCLNDSWDDQLLDKLRRAKADLRIVGKISLSGGYGLISLYFWLKRCRFDVAITWLFFSDLAGVTVVKWARIPRIIVSLQARNIHYGVIRRRLARAAIQAANAVVLNSTYVKEFAIAECGAQPDRLFIIPNGIRVDEYLNPIDQSALRTQMRLPPEGKILGSVGRLTRQKGYDVLLKAFSMLPDRSSHLLIFGDGEEESKLRTLSAELELQNRIHFVGYRHDLNSILGALDLYVHASRFEGMPHAIVEAMAAGRPIVATRVDGNRELIDDGVHGWLVPPDDPSALAKTIQEVLNHPEEANRRAGAARERIAKYFTLDTMTNAWEQLLLAR